MHYLGFFLHSYYMTSMFLYIFLTYQKGEYGTNQSTIYPIMMASGIAYPYIYDTIQLIK